MIKYTYQIIKWQIFLTAIKSFLSDLYIEMLIKISDWSKINNKQNSIKDTFAKCVDFMINKSERLIIINSFYETDSSINVMRVLNQIEKIRNSLPSIWIFRNVQILACYD